MENELTEFLKRHKAFSSRKESFSLLGVNTMRQAWRILIPEDLIWVVTRPGVMNAEQRIFFLIEVLALIEHLLTDPRSKKIFDKLRANEFITSDDKDSSARAIEDAPMNSKKNWDAKKYSRCSLPCNAEWNLILSARNAAEVAYYAASSVVNASWDVDYLFNAVSSSTFALSHENSASIGFKICKNTFVEMARWIKERSINDFAIN